MMGVDMVKGGGIGLGVEGCPNLACHIDDLVVLVRMVGEGMELVLDVEGFGRMYKPPQRMPWVVIPYGQQPGLEIPHPHWQHIYMVREL
ncbi:hypothetical protein Tco_0576614 [Tanacetum coccineum]